jgi:hypothetical protein
LNNTSREFHSSLQPTLLTQFAVSGSIISMSNVSYKCFGLALGWPHLDTKITDEKAPENKRRLELSMTIPNPDDIMEQNPALHVAPEVNRKGSSVRIMILNLTEGILI